MKKKKKISILSADNCGTFFEKIKSILDKLREIFVNYSFAR